MNRDPLVDKKRKGVCSRTSSTWEIQSKGDNQQNEIHVQRKNSHPSPLGRFEKKENPI